MDYGTWWSVHIFCFLDPRGHDSPILLWQIDIVLYNFISFLVWIKSDFSELNNIFSDIVSGAA